MSNTVNVSWEPHPQQLQTFQQEAQFEIYACGRKWGKTVNGARKLLIRLKPKGVYFWGAPSHQQSQLGYRECMDTWPREIIVKSVRTGPGGAMIELNNGATVTFQTLDNPENARGANPNGIVLDEAALINEMAWEAILKPNLLAKNGWMVALSSPRGNNWFRRLFDLGGAGGKTRRQPGYRSWQFPSRGNPYLSKAFLDEAKRTTSDRWWRQEHLAEFIEDAGGVFRNVDAAVFNHDGTERVPGGHKWVDGEGLTLIEPQIGQTYGGGLDLAKYQDFTSLGIRDAWNRLVYVERFNKIDYELQERRVMEVSHRYFQPKIVADMTGVGDRVVESLRRMGANIYGIVLTNQNKQQLADDLSIALDRGEVAIPNVYPLIRELKDYQYEYTKSRNVQLGAPEGQHDDMAMMMMLAWSVPLSRPLPEQAGVPYLAPVPLDGSAPDPTNPFWLPGGANDPFKQ